MLEYASEQRNLSDFNLMRRFALLRVPNVERGRCEFPNVRAVILDIYKAGMYKLGAKVGQLKGVYIRNQFEPLPNPHLSVSDVPMDLNIVQLRTKAEHHPPPALLGMVGG